jgi:ADP-ribose pyrophosphatase
MTAFRTTSTREAYAGRVRVRVDEVRGPSGATFQREVVESLDSVVLVPVLPDGRVVLVRQYRQPAGGPVLELPAGTLDVPGEAVLDAADRELAEEVGLGGGERRELGTFWVSPGWATERATFVLATGVTPVARPDGFTPAAEEAAMEVVRLPLDEALAAVDRNEVQDVTTAFGLLLAARHVGR